MASKSWTMEEGKTKEQQHIEREQAAQTAVKILDDMLRILNKCIPVPVDFELGVSKGFHADRQRNVGDVSSFCQDQQTDNVWSNIEKTALNEPAREKNRT